MESAQTKNGYTYNGTRPEEAAYSLQFLTTDSIMQNYLWMATNLFWFGEKNP